MDTLRGMTLPPGFGFHPKDTELIAHYLKRKIHGQKIEYEIIPEVDIYKHEPWDLPAKCDVPTQDNKWHFFASRDRKYPNGARSNRATVAGYWKSTGKDRTIKMDKRDIGTKKTLVFHEGRPPSGRRTEWIMHEYYIDENECQACPDMKDAFVLCRVTKRSDWASENCKELDKKDPLPEQPIEDDTSNISAGQPVTPPVRDPEQLNHADTKVADDEVPNYVVTPDTSLLDGGDELQMMLEELFDPSFNLELDSASPNLSLAEQSAESSNLGATDLKVEPYYASPYQNVVVDDTEYLMAEDIHSMLSPGTDNFHLVLQGLANPEAFASADQTYSMMGGDPFTVPNNFVNEELQLPQDNNEPNRSNETVDNGITRRWRTAATATSMSPSYGNVKLKVRTNRMVTSNSASINQTFENNSGRLDRITSVELQTNHARVVTSLQQSNAGKSSKGHSKQGFLSGIRKAFTGCSAAGLSILVTVCMVGVAAVVVHHVSHRSVGFRL